MSQDKELERQTLSEDEIDDIVTAQADDDSAWEAPIEVKRNRSAIDELALFWDTHDVTDFEDELKEVTEPVFASNLRTSYLIRLEPQEVEEVEKIAKARGVGLVALLRERVREKLQENNSGLVRDNSYQVPSEEKAKQGKTAADLFAGRIGRFRSGDGETLSEDTGKAFTEYVLKKKRDGTL